MSGTGPRLAIVARLTVRRDRLVEFRAFEASAVAIMHDHGGRLEQVVVLDDHPASPTLVEVHIVTFADASAFAAYRDDPALSRLQPMRDEAVVATQVEIGEEGPRYAGAAP